MIDYRIAGDHFNIFAIAIIILQKVSGHKKNFLAIMKTYGIMAVVIK